MREMTTEGLVSLKEPGLGPWRVGEGLLLRTSRGQRPLATEAAAREVLDSYAAARVAGVACPRPIEVVRVGAGYGVVVEYMPGVSLGAHIALGSYSLAEAGSGMGAFARRLHAAAATGGRDWNARFCRWSHVLEGLLEPAVGRRLAALVEAIPRRDALLHGDLHVANFVVCDGELAVIDMEGAGFGHPVLDLAVMVSRMRTNVAEQAGRLGIGQGQAERMGHELLEAFFGEYLVGWGEAERAEVIRRAEVLSAVERCCFLHGVGRLGAGGAGALAPAQLEAVRRLGECLAAELPHLDRLDF